MMKRLFFCLNVMMVSFFHLATGKGTLCLPGKGSSPEDGRLMLVTATDTCYTMEAGVTIGKKDSQAGLLLFYDENAYAGVSVDAKDITIYKDARRQERRPNTIGRKFLLRLENQNGLLSIGISKDGEKWTTLDSDIDVSTFHHNNFNGFIALRPCLYSAGKGQALISHFKYE